MEQKVYEYLTRIPKGKVVTYGQIAAALGNVHLCRRVGAILHQNPNPEEYPCYKVVNSRGKLSARFAFGGADGQRLRLEEDGITVQEDTVDLCIYRWTGEE